MFTPQFERGAGESPAEKTELEKKLDQLTLMRRKKAALEPQMKEAAILSEAERIADEYKDVSELIELIEKDIDGMKAAEKERLGAKFEHEQDASNDDAFDKALRATGEAQAADKLDKRKTA